MSAPLHFDNLVSTASTALPAAAASLCDAQGLAAARFPDDGLRLLLEEAPLVVLTERLRSCTAHLSDLSSNLAAVTEARAECRTAQDVRIEADRTRLRGELAAANTAADDAYAETVRAAHIAHGLKAPANARPR